MTRSLTPEELARVRAAKARPLARAAGLSRATVKAARDGRRLYESTRARLLGALEGGR